MNVGDEYPTNSYGPCVVLEIVNSSKVKVRFRDTGGVACFSSGNIRKGLVKDVLARSVHGIGFKGCGRFTAREKSGKLTREYSVWSSMMARCYDPQDAATERNYGDITVCDAWHNYQVFAEWCQTREDFHQGFELDKDILVLGNKVYGPDVCCFVPGHVNGAVTLEKHTNTTGYPGVWINRSGGYTAEVTMNGNPQSLGTFATPEAAFIMYRSVKEAYVHALADIYKSTIQPATYSAMKTWRVH